ncbi:MAG: riboflavin synthase [Halobacteriaceae archaeon]
MFTGIVVGTAPVEAVDETADGRRLRIGRGPLDGDLPDGASVSVSGTCLTVEDSDADAFEVFLAAETLDRTYLGDLDVGDAVNLERALRADDHLDGHVVQGHVDDTTTVEAVERVGEDWRYTFALPEDARYLVEKGSVALDGISLTVADIDRRAGTFDVAVVPTTEDLTTLSVTDPGDPVHVEYDVFAKYVESLLADHPATAE